MSDFEVDQVVQRALDRLTLLAETTTAMTSTLDPYAAVRRVCRILVPQLADWCAVDLLEDDGRPHRVSVVHRDPGRLPIGGLTGLLPEVPETPVGPLSRVLLGAGPLLLTSADMPGADTAADPLHARQLQMFDQLGTHNAVVAPIRARRQVLGALTIGRSADRASLTDDDLAMVEDLTHRIALGVDNARLYRETQRIAERLQRSLLPTLPRTGPLRLAARYAPAASTAEVGGDWYDSSATCCAASPVTARNRPVRSCAVSTSPTTPSIRTPPPPASTRSSTRTSTEGGASPTRAPDTRRPSW
ncbi:GAF domain-containing protein [Streptomyces sp. G44]|nr:GAF domain-containing protein [Streptomyces sp. G44]